MNSKMTTNSQLSTTEPKKKKPTKNKNKLSKQQEQEQNHRNGGYQQGSGRGREGGKVQRISSIDDRWKTDRGG